MVRMNRDVLGASQWRRAQRVQGYMAADGVLSHRN